MVSYSFKTDFLYELHIDKHWSISIHFIIDECPFNSILLVMAIKLCVCVLYTNTYMIHCFRHALTTRDWLHIQKRARIVILLRNCTSGSIHSYILGWLLRSIDNRFQNTWTHEDNSRSLLNEPSFTHLILYELDTICECKHFRIKFYCFI